MRRLTIGSSHSSGAWRILQLLLLAVMAWAATYTRVALGPLQEAIKGSLVFSDNQIALLQGMGLALPLALGSIPLGLLADRASRTRMLSVCIAIAAISCVLSALASGFATLLAARSLAGLSVAGILVAVYSMAGDLFAPTERGRATAVMSIGEVCGAPAAFAIGGALLAAGASGVGQKLEDWSSSLLWMSAVLAPVVLLTLLLREPARAIHSAEKPQLRAIWRELWRYRGVALPVQLARATLFIADGAVFVWGAPLFARTYQVPSDRIGILMGVVLLAGGLLGPALAGPLVDYCQRRGGPRLTVTVMAGVAILSVPAGLFALMPTAHWASLLLGIFLVLGFTIGSAALALSIIVIPSELRGLNLGISLVVGSLFFIGLAPLVVSGVSTALGGEAMLDKALAIVCGTMSVLNAAVLLIGRRNFPDAVKHWDRLGSLSPPQSHA